MGYEKVQGDQLFDGATLWKNGKVLVHDGQGRKLDIINRDEAGDDVRFIPGLITPGFVNAHCHVELSHLKDAVPPRGGLVAFLLGVVGKRDADEETIVLRASEAIREMEEDGIIAVGDICNTTNSIAPKKTSSITWKNFVEVISLQEANTPERMKHYEAIRNRFTEEGLDAVLSPHAPYSVNPAAFRQINEAAAGKLISIHNQETKAENELFKSGSGPMLRLYRALGMENSPLPVTGLSSIRTYLPWFSAGQRVMLVHNTYTSEEELDWALDHAQKNGLELVFCFCVNANLYIEDRLPNLQMFLDKGCKMVLGTDSYSSNTALRISHEISTIRTRYPDIPVETILQWSTVNGASALGVESKWVTGIQLP